MAKVLVTGGAGYVGAHCCYALARAGHEVVVYDNLVNGHAVFAKWGPFEHGDIRDRARLKAVLAAHRPDIVVHCAGLVEVGVSVRDPGEFYDNNVAGSLTLLAAMREAGIDRFVFSSTCSIFGEPQTPTLDEGHRQAPLNPYAWTKLAVEQAVRDFAAAYGLRYTLLRYFNAAGAAPDAGIGEKHEPETHVIPLALFAAIGKRAGFSVFGTDYPTRDGSCIRDYVHVLDLADAHVRAVDRLLAGGGNLACNLGTGTGVTVLELLAAVERVTGKRVPAALDGRRTGDSPSLVADNSLARRELGWAPTRGIDACIADAWKWHTEVEPKLFEAKRSA
jgi:UDP-glucose 4-epimerase